jgi:hypothetical protein
MNMVKEGIQTRRRKQKMANNGSSPSKSKHKNQLSPTKESKSCTSESNMNHGSTAIPDEYLARQGNYPYGELYPQHLHLVQQRFPSQQQMEMTTSDFDAELCAREIVTSPEQH